MMHMHKPELIVTREWAAGKIFVFFGLLVGVGVGVVAVQTAQDVRSKAAPITVSPSPLVEIIASPDASLVSPYIRFVSDKNNYKTGEKVTVSVYVHTGGEAVVESKLQIKFDPKALTFLEDEIKLEEAFKSFDVNVEPGFIFLDLFINSQVGHAPVATTAEKKVAILTFVTKEVDKKETVIDIEFDKESSESSQLTSLSDAREEKPKNLLNTVSGVAFDITP